MGAACMLRLQGGEGMALHRFAFRLFAAVGIAAVAMAQSTTTTRVTYFPATGLGGTEAMRVNVTNIATTPANGPVPLCAGSICFIDASGNTIGTATSLNVASGTTRCN